MMEAATRTLSQYGVVPVVKIPQVHQSVPLATALRDGGLPVAEITFRTSAAAEAIRAIRAEVPEVIAGAGTVLNLDQARAAVDAGATFVVTPGMSRPVIEFCIENGVPVIPGGCTPTELMIAREYNLPVVKFFPAADFGGLKTIKSLAAVFSGMDFMPTGGVSITNLADYLQFPRVAACGGTWMVPTEAIENADFERIRGLSAESVRRAREVRQAPESQLDGAHNMEEK